VLTLHTNTNKERLMCIKDITPSH